MKLEMTAEWLYKTNKATQIVKKLIEVIEEYGEDRLLYGESAEKREAASTFINKTIEAILSDVACGFDIPALRSAAKDISIFRFKYTGGEPLLLASELSILVEYGLIKII